MPKHNSILLIPNNLSNSISPNGFNKLTKLKMIQDRYPETKCPIMHEQ